MLHQEGVRLLRLWVALRRAVWVEDSLLWQTVQGPRSEIVRANSRYVRGDIKAIPCPLKAILGDLNAIRSKESRKKTVNLLFLDTGFTLCVNSLTRYIADDKGIRPNITM